MCSGGRTARSAANRAVEAVNCRESCEARSAAIVATNLCEVVFVRELGELRLVVTNRSQEAQHSTEISHL